MELDKLSLELERSLELARDFAERRGDALITPTHVLYVMLEPGGALSALVEKQQVNRLRILDFLVTRAAAENTGRRLEPGKRPIAGKPLRDFIEQAFAAAEQRNAELVAPIDFLTGVFSYGDELLRHTLHEAGLQSDALKKATRRNPLSEKPWAIMLKHAKKYPACNDSDRRCASWHDKAV